MHNTSDVKQTAAAAKAEMRARLIAEAAADMATWPQYRGHFEGYVLVLVKRQVKTKLGVAFAAGEFAIASPAERVPETGPYAGKVAFRTVYSRRNKVDTSVRASHVEVLG